MLFLENLKPLKIYKRPLFLPTVPGNKKKKSAIFLLTPNYESSRAIMNNTKLFTNKLRFASYYIEKDLTYFISSKVMNKVDDVTETYIRDYNEFDFYQNLCEMTAAERNALKDTTFGLPEKRKYPLNDEDHVRSAIRFFNYVSKDDEEELARNIKKAIKKFHMKVNVGEKNRFSKYYTAPATESALLEMTVSSNIDKDFRAKGKKDLSEYRKEKITKELATQHKEFKHVRYDTDDCISFWDGSDLVGYVCVENKDYYHWITALEVMPPYQGYGLGTQILKYAIDTMNADALSVSKKNNVAYEMYKNAGFYVFKDDSNMYYMTTDSTKAALNTESVNLSIYEGKVSKRNNGNYTYRFYDDDNTEVCEVSMDYGDEDNPGNYIYDFKVMKDYRNRGIGTSLLEYAITDLGGDRLIVDKGNRIALHMYEEAGFEITGDDNNGKYTMSLNEDKLSAKDRNALRDSTFGVPSKRKFPLNDESHVRSAIRFFNKVAPEDEETLARNIKKAIKKFNMTVNVGKDNRFSKYYHPAAANESYLMHEAKISNIYHLSSEYREEMKLDPRVPDNFMTKNGYEDNKTKRVCFSTSINGCLIGMSKNLEGAELYVYTPIENIDVYTPSVNEVPDCKFTGEVWVKKPITVKCIGKIKVGKAKDKPMKYAYGDDNIAELYDWNYTMIENYDESYIEEEKMYAKERNALKDSSFGVPSKRKFPLNDKAHVQAAIRFFNKVDPEDEKTLARNLNKAINKFFSKDNKPKVGKNNRFSKYYTGPITESDEMLDEVSDVKENPMQFIKELNRELNKYDYGVRVNGKILYDGPSLDKYYKTETAEQFEKSKIGICYDFVTYQDARLKEEGIPYENYFIMIPKLKTNTTHSITVAKVDGKYVYMESSFSKIAGVHTATKLEDIFNYVVSNMIGNTKGDFDYFIVKFDKGKIGVSAPDYIADMSSKATVVDSTYIGGNPTNKGILDESYLIEEDDDINVTNTPDTALVSVSGIIIENSKILLEDHIKCDAYTLPGGKVEPNEDISDAIIRELKEELNITIPSYDDLELLFVNIFKCEYPANSGSYTWFKDYCYYIKDYVGEITLMEHDKHRSIEFVKPNEIGREYKCSKVLCEVMDELRAQYADQYNVDYIPPEKITCSGYLKDLDVVSCFTDTELYESIMRDLGFTVLTPKNIPFINIIAAENVDDQISIIRDNQGENGAQIIVDVANKTVDELTQYLMYALIYGILGAKYPEFPEPIIDDIARYMTDMPLPRATDALIDKTMDNRTAAETIEYLQREHVGEEDWAKSIAAMDAKLNKGTSLQEKKDMSAESLTNAIKFRGSTKNKIAVGKIRNKASNLNDKIKNDTPEAPKASTSSNSKDGAPTVDVNAKSSDNNKITEAMLESMSPENYLKYGDGYITFFDEANASYDVQLKKILYKERFRQRKEVVALLDRAKADVPYIKWAYPDLKRYQQKNLFVDLYYYQQCFFKNNTWKQKKGLNLYIDFLDRLINDKRIKQAGYTRRTVFIPVLDWHQNPGTRMWMFREDLNPVSVIYYLMQYNPNELKRIFKGVDVLFFTPDKYFTINFEDITKATLTKFRGFIKKMQDGEEFDAEDIDTSEDVDTPEAIKTTIMDDIDVSKGVDLTAANAKVEEEKKNHEQLGGATTVRADNTVRAVAVKKDEVKKETTSREEKPKEEEPVKEEPAKPRASSVSSVAALNKKLRANAKQNAEDQEQEVEDAEKTMSKSVANKPETDSKIKSDEETQKEIIRHIDNNLEWDPGILDVDDAYDAMDDDQGLKDLLIGLDSMADDSVDISQARADRMSTLDRELLDKSIKGRTIKEILDVDDDPTKPEELPETDLPVASPNPEWKDMTYMNFDKTYDMEKDIIRAFEHFTTVSHPMAIRNITAVDNSTSEDYMDTYTCEYEDYRGKRYTIKLDIPKVINERFLIRGNKRMLQTQFFNMPIVKTADDVCQIVSNYKKIIISRYNTSKGKSIPSAAKLIKTADKYTGRRIKFSPGDNTLICNKYDLPIDYIDLSTIFSTIETDVYKVYFNQDEIRREYVIDEGLGTPVAYDKKNKTIIYYPDNATTPFADVLFDLLKVNKERKIDDDFVDLFNSMKAPAKGMYSRAKIMGAEIPLVLICAYHEGLTNVMKKANIEYEIVDKLTPDIRNNFDKDYIRFKDGYLVYNVDYNSSLLMNGLKDCDCELQSVMDIDEKSMYLEFLDDFGGRIKADGLENFYDCEIDPITKETLAYYRLPTDYISCLLYANRLLADNKFIKHTDVSSRRARRFELVAAYTYQVLAETYSTYANSIKHNRNAASFSCKQSAVIDKILSDPTSSDYSTCNLLNDIESTNAITTKGLSGLNANRSYSLDKRTYDDSMINVVGMSTGFANNVGITRQATMDMNIEGERGYVKETNGNLDSMNTAKTLTATEAVVPLSATHDDPFRVAMTFIQSSKHMVRTEHSDPLLVTNGADEALPYLCSDQFAYKAKQDGVVADIDDHGMIVEYKDGSKDYINLDETIEKNSDGGFFVPLKLDPYDGIKKGSKIKANQILAYDRTSLSNSAGEDDNIAYDVGTLAKVAIINTDEGFEDSGIVTHKLAKQLTTKIITMADCTLNKSTNIYNMAKVGQNIEQGDALLVWQTPYDEEEINNLLKALANDSDAISEIGRHTVRSEVTGKLVGIKMYRTVELDELSDSLKDAFKKYEQPISELKQRLADEDIDTTTLPANYPLKPAGKLKKAGDGVLIEFYIEYEDIVGAGDKITYNAANKAVIKSVIPEGKEPYTDFRPHEEVSALVSSTSIAKRMVTSTRVYGYLQKLMVELDRSCKDLAGIPYDDSSV